MGKINSIKTIIVGNNVHAYETVATASLTSSYSSSYSEQNEPYSLGVGIDIFARGENNNLPTEIKDALELNHIAPSINNKKLDLLYGQGAFLYKNIIKDGKLAREYTTDSKIESWLSTWDFRTYLRKVAINYFANNITVSKAITRKNRLIGNLNFISHLESVLPNEVGIEFVKKLPYKNVFVGDFDTMLNITKHHVFDCANPLKYRNPVIVSEMPTLGDKAYPKPSFYGAMNWIKRSSSIPKILESLDNNSLNFKFHIKVPAWYWNAKRDELRTQCLESKEVYNEQMLIDYQDEIFKGLSTVLAGTDNVGKFFTSDYVSNQFGKLEGWEIEAIDMKVQDYEKSKLNIATHSDFAVASGMNLNPTLANLSFASGKVSSGSEQLYALKLHLATNNQITEEIVTQALNYFIKAMFHSDLQIGFYHNNLNTEEEVSPKERL